MIAIIKMLQPVVVVCALVLPWFSAKSQPTLKTAAYATHIASITKDTIVVITGSTYRFTVDTPEDQGLVSTTPTVNELLAQITCANGSKQQYLVTDITGKPKQNDKVTTGDRLMVTSQEKTSKTWRLVVKPMALSGRLQLQQRTATINTTGNLVLYYTAGQRSPDATVNIYLPPGIRVTMQNTTVNVIGRGDVTLSQLAQQSIGRTGSAYSYNRVGAATIISLANGGTKLQLSHLDLRPANGADLTIVIGGVRFPKAGNYAFKATYTTSEPEVLTSAGTGAETAILKAIPTLADFTRTAERTLHYREDAGAYTRAHFTWSYIPAKAIQLLQSLDTGKSFQRASASIDYKNSSATVTGLQPDKLYTFRLLVKDGMHKGFSNTAQFY